METGTAKKPKTMVELLPGLSGILSKDAIQTLTAKMQPRATMAVQSRTVERGFKPLTMAEMRADLKALNGQSPKRYPQSATSTKKRNWNSSVKIDKKISHTADGQLKNNPVRKVLKFQSRPKAIPNSRVTMLPLNPDTPKFPKPEFRAKKALHLQARNTVRISGVYNIPETPVLNKPRRTQMTLSNKENIPKPANVIKKPFVPIKPVTHHRLIVPPAVPDTPLSNESWKSSCDASFLQKEKEINDIEEKTKALTEEQTLENIAEVSPPVSTPFKEYRNVKEYFNNSSELETSALCNDDTIMCFEKPSQLKVDKDNKREESVIVSLCDLLNKAKVTNSENTSTELEDLLEVEKQTQNNIKMIEDGIQTLNNIKESHLKSLQYVRKLISGKRNGKKHSEKHSETEHDRTLVMEGNSLTPKTLKKEKYSPKKSPILGKPCSVIKSPTKSPSYKIPKKNLCLRKKVFYKSMPNVSNGMQTPNKDIENRALSIYMKMKEQMNFLNTPIVKHNISYIPDTPAVTSHNLQMQLDKLYGGS